jgi:hypothetical protein
MKALFILLSAIGTILTGCTSPFQRSQDHIKVEVFDSPVVIMEHISLDRRDGVSILTGSVVKRTDIKDTAQTHLDVTCYDAAGQVLLLRTMEHFEPRQIPAKSSRPNYATYRVILNSIPAGTARIEVRAHEGAHASQ